MSLPLVVGVDGSESSLRAVDWAADEAALHGAPLRIVHAYRWYRYEGTALARELGKPSGHVAPDDILVVATRRARRHHPDLSVTTEAVAEEPEYVLTHEARTASAVIVGTRGRGELADLLLGSVSLTVATEAHCPVVVIRGSHGNRTTEGRHGRIVVGMADAPTAAVRFAYEEARRRGAALDAVRAWRCPAHDTADHPLLTGTPERLHEERAAKELEAALADAPPDVRLRRHTVEGPARRVLLTASHEADLLIVGRRRPGQFGHRLGRIAHTLLHHSACPVAVVPDTA
ncbi:universal stress protein [Streptomyces virens]|uniref:Universal stress protein n=1 Tax=Streptomyces virens TaxID=285572 RepID=A0ABP6PAC3_9ACTN|nr:MULTISPECIES: universal stress protein [Streptomyces]MBA8976691.1 nucleotide-binding universal stress UspA family protein [Streptomyces calvus]MYS31241.1 universal stress protein [Streptomyces sp. SID7804]